MSGPNDLRIPPLPAPISQAATTLLARLRDSQSGPMLVAGGPGTGKTGLLVECVAELVSGGMGLHQVLVLAATRPLAQRLRTTIMKRIGGAQVAPRVMTAHALAHAIIRENRTPEDPEWTLLTAPEQEFRLREMLANHDTSHWPEDLRAAASTRAFAGEVRAATARVRQLGLDPADVELLAQEAGRPEWAVLGEFMAEYLDVVDATAAMDYAELVHRARLALASPQVLAAVQRRTPVALVDDLTELDTSQVQLLADLVSGGTRLIAFADPSTSVYGFRGAAGLQLRQFESVFSGAGMLPERLTLGADLDRGARITEALANISKRLPRNDNLPLPTPLPDALPGRVEVKVLDSPGAEVEHIVGLLRRAHLEDGLAWHQMAVVTRTHRGGLLSIARALTSAGVPVQVAGNDIALREAPAVRPLLLALRAVVAHHEGERLSPDDALSLLRSPLGGLDSLEARRLGRELRLAHPDQPATSGEWFARLLAAPEIAEGLTGSPAEKAVALAHRLAGAVDGLNGGADASRTLWALWDGSDWSQDLQREALAARESSAAANRDIDSVRALFDLAAKDTGLVGARSVRLLLNEIEGHEIPADTARESDIHQRGVQLLTAHRTKGQRWPLVVVAQVQEGSWPATRRRSSILDTERLTREGVADPEPYSRLIDAERRSFLLACSRATDRLVVTSAQGHEGEGDQRSRFLDELGTEVEVVHGRPGEAVTLPMMVAELRLTATDPMSSPALREAAARRLARLAELRDLHGHAAARGADPGSWWGMNAFTEGEAAVVPADQPVELHGSELGGLLECPRRWFLSRRARGEAGRSSASSFGSVIHALVGHAATEEADLDELRGHLDSVWDRLQFDAAWLSSSERAEADTALTRYLLWLEQNGRTLLGTEIPFDVVIDVGIERVRLKGTVDRLELDSQDRLHVVDFKTGRRPPSKKEAAADAQLGLYQLVAMAGGFDELAPGVREVGGARLVFLRSGSDEFPDVLEQPPLSQQLTLDGEELVVGPTWMHDMVAAAAHTIRAERFFAQPNKGCRYCPFAVGCPATIDQPVTGR